MEELDNGGVEPFGFSHALIVETEDGRSFAFHPSDQNDGHWRGLLHTFSEAAHACPADNYGRELLSILCARVPLDRIGAAVIEVRDENGGWKAMDLADAQVRTMKKESPVPYSRARNRQLIEEMRHKA